MKDRKGDKQNEAEQKFISFEVKIDKSRNTNLLHVNKNGSNGNDQAYQPEKLSNSQAYRLEKL